MAGAEFRGVVGQGEGLLALDDGAAVEWEAVVGGDGSEGGEWGVSLRVLWCWCQSETWQRGTQSVEASKQFIIPLSILVITWYMVYMRICTQTPGKIESHLALLSASLIHPSVYMPIQFTSSRPSQTCLQQTPTNQPPACRAAR